MKINKQLFEDILSGKLKGIFVLRNGETYFSDSLHQNYNKFRKTHPYAINLWSYTSEGKYFEDITSILDVVDFIPYIFVIDSEIYSYNKNDIEFIEHFINGHYMKENELTIKISEGQEIDWQESAKQEKIVFKKKKDNKPRSWEEYCKNFKGQYYYIQDNRDNIATSFTPNGLVSAYKNYVPSEELAESFLAMMQLMSLRQAWIGDWKPDWNDETRVKWNIICLQNQVCLCDTLIKSHVLSFPTEEMATDFMNCFKDLLNVARPLI